MGKKLAIIIAIVSIAIIIVITITVVILLRRRRGEPSQPLPSPSPPPPPDPTTPGVRYYLADECPSGTTKIGKVGLIGANSDLSHIPFTQGSGYIDGWTWIHPYICQTSNPSTNADKLYKLSPVNSNNLGGRVGVLWDKDNNPPFDKGMSLVANWIWTHPFVVPVTDPDGYHFVPQGVGIGPTGLIGSNNDLNNLRQQLGNDPSGNPYNPDWTWIHPNLESE